jgi:GxxExxY protein
MNSTDVLENSTSRAILDAAIEVHRQLGGPGLLESVYEEALACELEIRGHFVVRQCEVPLRYKGRTLALALRLDLVVDQCVIVECKAAAANSRVFDAQALTYLRLTGLRLALVINFGQPLVRQGTRRIVHGLV